jgi:hypothetical protein
VSDTPWNIESLKEHFDSVLHDRDERFGERFTSQEKAVDAALAAAEKAVTKAETATEKRFDGVNEFRQTLSDQARDFMPRKEYEAQQEGLARRITALERGQSSSGGRTAGTDLTYARVINVLAVVVAAAAILVAVFKP